jgi:hypothetical protein
LYEQKTKELELPEEEQHELLLAREKYTPNTLHTTDGRVMQDKLKDPVVFKIFKRLERGSSVECFIELFASKTMFYVGSEHDSSSTSGKNISQHSP